jgi:hypothetical protein
MWHLINADTELGTCACIKTDKYPIVFIYIYIFFFAVKNGAKYTVAIENHLKLCHCCKKTGLDWFGVEMHMMYVQRRAGML